MQHKEHKPASAAVRVLWRAGVACALALSLMAAPGTVMPLQHASAESGNPEDGTGYNYPLLADVDLDWFDPAAYSSKSTYKLKTAAQLAGLAYLTYGHTKNDNSDAGNPKTHTTNGKEVDKEYPYAWKKDDCKAYSFEGKTVALEKDIDLKSVCSASLGVSWRPIGSGYGEINGNVYFRGTFDGQNHTVKNLYINNTQYYAALFGNVYKGEVKNLTVTGVVNSGACCAGVVAKCSSTNLSNLTNRANVTASEKSPHDNQGYVSSAAGVVCYAMSTGSEDVVFDRLENSGDIQGYSYYTGGVVGFGGAVASSGGTLTISRSSNSGNVSVSDAANTSDDDRAVGGVLGASTGMQYGGAVMLQGCYNSGDVSSTNLKTTGGLTGFLGGSGSYVKSSYNTGNVSGSANAGGIVGVLAAKGSGNGIFNSYNAGMVKGTTAAGVLAKSKGDGSEFQNNFSTGSRAYGPRVGVSDEEQKDALTTNSGLKSQDVKDALNTGVKDAEKSDFAFGIRASENGGRLVLGWGGGFDQGSPEESEETQKNDENDEKVESKAGGAAQASTEKEPGKDESSAKGKAAGSKNGESSRAGAGNGPSDSAGTDRRGNLVSSQEIDTGKLQPLGEQSDAGEEAASANVSGSDGATEEPDKTSQLLEIASVSALDRDLFDFLGTDDANVAFVVLACALLAGGISYENISFARRRGTAVRAGDAQTTM